MQPDGTKNSFGAAPDGEEFFAMALFSQRTAGGDGEGIFNYSREAEGVAAHCIHKGENGEGGRAMWDASNHLIRFITDVDFFGSVLSSASFYELFALWAKEETGHF